MKIWPFDYVRPPSRRLGQLAEPQGLVRSRPAQLRRPAHRRRDLEQGLEPFRKIREAVGDEMEIMVEGHGLWSLPAAKQIAHALEEFQPGLARRPDARRRHRRPRRTSAQHDHPILASEYLTTRYEYKPLLEKRAADIIMIDPTWAGGITESKKIATMAETYKRPVAMHDCTGPFTLYAGIHLAINATNAVYQETVRAYLQFTYPEFVTDVIKVVDGHIEAPTAPGLGTSLLPEVRTRPDSHIQISELH